MASWVQSGTLSTERCASYSERLWPGSSVLRQGSSVLRQARNEEAQAGSGGPSRWRSSLAPHCDAGDGLAMSSKERLSRSSLAQGAGRPSQAELRRRSDASVITDIYTA